MVASFEGRLRLASRNLMPNGDLDDVGIDAPLEGWTLEAPPKVSGWYPYFADAPGDPFHRQLFDALPVRRRGWKMDTPWIRGAQPEDVTAESRIAAPKAFAVDLVPLEDIGFGAGTYPVAICYGVGSPNAPKRRLRWTEPSSFTNVVVPEDGMGIEVPLPDRPEGITFYAIVVGRRGQSAATARLQEIVVVRYGARDSVKLRGPWVNGPAPPTSGANRTFIGSLGESDPPRVERSSFEPGNRSRRAHSTLQAGDYQFRVLKKTEFGYGLPSEETRWFTVQNREESTALWVAPRREPNTGTEAFALEVRGRRDGNQDPTDWQRLTADSGRTEWPPGRFVPVFAYSASGLPDHQRLEASFAESEDASGVARPETELEVPTTFGGAPMGPGRKRLKASWAYNEEDDSLGRSEERESAPSPMVTVDVPGVAGAATHTIRFFRPPGMNEEKNPLFVNLRRDEREEDWVRDPEGASGAIFGPQLGYSEVTDTTGLATNQTVYYSAPVDVTNANARAVRMSVELPSASYVSGKVRADIQFLNSSGAVLRTDRLGGRGAAGETFIHRTLGPQGGKEVDHRWPANTTHYRRKFVHIGTSTSGVRNLVAIYRDVGAYPGLAHPLKRFDVEEIDERKDEEDFPPNAYAVMLSRELVDRENIRPRQNVGTPVRDLMDFDDGIPADLTLVGSPVLTDDHPVSGTQSLLCADLSATVAGTPRARYQFQAPRAEVSAAFAVRVEQMPTVSGRNVARLMSQSGAELCVVTLTTSGALSVAPITSLGTGTAVTIYDDLDTFEDLSVEVHASGAGTASGRLRVYIAREGRRRVKVYDVSGIAWGDRQVSALEAGLVSGGGVSALASVTVDEIEVWARGEQDFQDVPGRMFEYWASDETPKHPHNGMRGMKVPVSGGTTQILSAFAEVRGARVDTDLLRFVAKNEAGDVLSRYGPLVGLVRGRRRMRRYHRRVTWPADATYIEFTGNDLGAGLVRIAGIQLEDDTPDGSPSAFTNEHAPSGFVEVEFDLQVPGVPTPSWLDENNELAPVAEGGPYRDIRAAADEPENTQVTVSFAASNTRGYPALTTDLLTLQEAPGRFLKVRASLATTDLQTTPELKEMLVDFRRKYAVVCRGDGTEVLGGAVPVDFPAVQDKPRIEVEERADNSLAFSTFGERQRRADGWTIEAYYDEGVAALAREIGRGDSTLIVEELGKRFHCQITNLPIGPPDRRVNVAVPGTEHGGFLFTSDAIEAVVVGEEDL